MKINFLVLWIMKNMPSLCNIRIRMHSNSTQWKVHSGDEDLSISGGGLRSLFASMAEMRRHKCLCPCLFQCLNWHFVLQYQAALQPPQTLKGLSLVPALWHKVHTGNPLASRVCKPSLKSCISVISNSWQRNVQKMIILR